MSSDSPFSMSRTIGASEADQAPSPQQNAGEAWQGTADYAKSTKDRSEAAKAMANLDITTSSKTGDVEIKGLKADALGHIMEKLKMADQITANYEKMRKENQQQQDALKAHPFANALSQIAASVGASSRDPLVRGLGDAAQRLNPTMQQLQGQQMGLMKAEEGGLEHQTRLLEQLGQHQAAAQYHKDTLDSKRMDDRGRIEKDAGISARRGEFDKDTYVKELISAGEDPNRALAAGDRLEKVSGEAQKRNDAAVQQRQKELDAKEANLQKSMDARAAQTDKMIAAADRRAAMAAERGDAKAAKAEEKKKDPSPVLKKQLADLGGADNALNEIEKILKDPENHSLMGPYAGRAAEAGAKLAPGLADPTGKIKGLIGKLGLQTAQAIKATGAGARGFGPQERPYFEKLAEAIHNTPEQNLKILENWRHFLDQERKGITAANPDVDWTGKYGPALGPRLGTAAESSQKKYPWEK